jgi:hypothetical protein
MFCLALLAVGGRAQAEPAKQPVKDSVSQEARFKIEADVENCREPQSAISRRADQAVPSGAVTLIVLLKPAKWDVDRM